MSQVSDRVQVLLVEDNEDNLNIYKTFLLHVGYTVETAGDGRTGLEMITQLRPELVLLDVSMPEMDGWEVCTRVKASAALGDVQIVMLTAHAMAEDEKKAYEIGADGYIRKPVTPRAVIDEVRRFIGGPRAKA